LTRTQEERLFILFCFVTEALLFWAALNLATLTRLPSLTYVNLWRLQLDRLVCVGLFATGALFAGAYDLSRIGDPFDAVYYSWSGLLFTGLIEMALVSLLPVEARVVSRRELLLALIASAAFLGIWRVYAARLISRFASLRRFFYVFGHPADGRRIAEALASSEGHLVDAQYVTLEAVAHRTDAHGNEEAILALGSENRDALLDVLAYCEEHCRRVFLYPSLHDARLFKHGGVHAVAGIPLIELATSVDRTSYLYLKRLIDVTVSASALVFAAPICVLTAIAIAATSPGGVFYTQERIGKGGRRFKLYKFRSMVANAEAHTGPVWAAADDARVTSVGRFIRKHRIDEIPQLWNVLKGDMSLIGPRPERPHFHEEFLKTWPLFDKRLAVRPGLSSLSHVLGSYDSSPEDRLRYDLIYIGNLSFLTDLHILFSTVRVVLGAKGAQ
jgi:exopolysaccharide biosynthesis polyprenyl glycosylphosphotransferase